MPNTEDFAKMAKFRKIWSRWINTAFLLLQVRRMVLELQRISLLWDELWIGTIQQYGTEINRRVKKMDDEVRRLNVNQNLSEEEKKTLAKDKYNIVFRPLLYIFEQASFTILF